jgi:hypothetical protein
VNHPPKGAYSREYFSRKGAKAQRKPFETRQRFAPLREKYFFALDP